MSPGEFNDVEVLPFDQCMILIYFAFTTLSTIGFGDYYPYTNFERAFGSMVLLSGVAIFSYIMGVFVEIIQKFIELDADFEDSDNLEKFYSLM